MAAGLKEKVLETLKNSVDPSLAEISEVVVDKAQVYVALDVDPAQGAKLEPLRQKAQAAVEAVSGVESARVVLTAEKNRPPAPAAAKGAPQVTHKISFRPIAPAVKHIIAVASGKGGVGKSTVSANLAVALARLGKKTGLLDADIYGSSQPTMMGVRQRPETDASEMILPLEKDVGGAEKLKIMSMGFFVEPEAPIIWRGPMVHSAIQQLLRDVAWGDLDILVIDLPPGTGDAQLSLAQYVPLSGAVIVSTPQDVALSEAKKGLRMFEKTGVKILGMIENMSTHTCSACGHEEHIFGHGAVAKAAQAAGIDFLGDIPLLKEIRLSADQGQISPAADAIFKNMAARLFTALPAQMDRARVGVKPAR